MNLKEFSRVNMERCINGFNHRPESWSSAEWTNAMCGEAGEAANLAKKIIRHRDGVEGNVKPGDDDVLSLRRRCMKEAADTIISADLLIQSFGGDTSDVLRDVFNAKSDELNLPHKV